MHARRWPRKVSLPVNCLVEEPALAHPPCARLSLRFSLILRDIPLDPSGSKYEPAQRVDMTNAALQVDACRAVRAFCSTTAQDSSMPRPERAAHQPDAARISRGRVPPLCVNVPRGSRVEKLKTSVFQVAETRFGRLPPLPRPALPRGFASLLYTMITPEAPAHEIVVVPVFGDEREKVDECTSSELLANRAPRPASATLLRCPRRGFPSRTGIPPRHRSLALVLVLIPAI